MRTPTVCSEYLVDLLQYIENHGVDAKSLITAIGFTPEQHLTAEGRFPLRLFEVLMDVASVMLDDSFLGAHAGADSSPTAWGMVSYIGMSAPNSRAAFDSVAQFSRLLIDHGDVMFSELGSDLTQLVWVVPERKPVSRHLAEFFFTSLYRANKAILNRWCNQREVCFSHAGPEDISEIERILEAPVKYNCSANYVEFDSHFLDRPTRFPHTGIYNSLVQTARAELAKLQMEDRIVKDVIASVLRHLPSGVPKLDNVAAELGLAPRTLQRRLNNTDVNFKSLVDDARKQRSRQLVGESDMALLDISAELGFSDQSSFQKAFKRWFGLAPGRYRMSQQLLNNSPG
ncbi:putative HTH-type transcriptional regulator [Zhongshania aliphaticivorans]|uniref:Putative HTH-type transcriptional regulator n=1 Tax=Zhongshania aliphaticivorans TaxID=1470434 RepID=A0A5S9NK51_9GAMM|nr:AraC family transcriptional regulator [Zhongshania aliphaticivorans]CAA0090232.1 putative HTH-type transcriptional regulator [Zhongshania aliphaticivorans]CAA0097630.1 putative HTH-type transcriptional regulator [Zhongshania aliphaticivorans]